MISYLILILLLIYMFYDEKNRIVIGIIMVIWLIFYYGYLWGQIFNIYAVNDYKTKNYKNKMLWINTNMLDVTNIYHKQWANYVLIDSAPNKLGIYIEDSIVNKLFVLKQMETFKIMFGYNSPIIFFKHRPNNIIRTFCEQKGVQIVTFSFRKIL